MGWSAVLTCQSCGFDPPSGHIQVSTKERISKWNNKSEFLSFSLYLFLPHPLSLSKINTLKKKEGHLENSSHPLLQKGKRV